jgi:HEPN domain-containing protein
VVRKDLQELSKVRLKEAAALLKLGLPDGAYYLAGYSVECALKACIAKPTRRSEFPDKKRADSSYSHNLRELIRVAGLDEAFKGKIVDVDFRGNWRVVQYWSEQSRYQRHSLESARALLMAITDKRHGVFTWIKAVW